MTIRYNQAVATAQCGGFLKLLFRWEGSVYKLLWFELAIFLGLYATISISYHFLMNDWSKRTFEAIAVYCDKYSNQIPIAFVLGFYVQRVINRFWEQFVTIPWPNRLAIYVSTYIQSNDERARLMRRTIMRYIYLGFVMSMSSISPPIKRRFPTMTHMTEAGFLLANEQQSLETVKTNNNKYFVPFVWATSIVANARKEGKIKSDIAVQKLIAEINDFRGGCGGLFMFDWVSIPLGYTQVVSLAVYIFSLCCLLGRYQLDVGAPAEKHFPFFTILQFVFYMGWLKVAECGLSPFGDDDDDFEINLLVDRYLHESYMVVDEMFMNAPDILKDQYWDLVDFDIPYTAAAAPYRKSVFLGSTTGMEVPADKQAFVPNDASYVSLVNTSSTVVMSSHVIRRTKSRRRLKRKSTLTEVNESRESVVAHAVSSTMKDLDAAVRPADQDEQQSDTAAGQRPVEAKPSTSAGQQPSTSGGEQPSSSAEQQPGTSAEQRPSTSAEQQPGTSAEQRPSTSAEQRPSTSAEQQPGTSAEQRPSTSDEQRPSTSDEQRPSTLAEQRPSTSDEQRPSISAEQRPRISAEQQPSTLVEQRPSTLAEQRPSISAEQQPSTLAEQRPSSSDEQRPSTLVEQRPSISTEQRPRISAEQQPSTSVEQRSSTSAEQQPSTSAEQRPSTSAEQRPSTSAKTETQQNTTSDSTLLTQQESNLMTKIYEELRELRK